MAGTCTRMRVDLKECGLPEHKLDSGVCPYHEHEIFTEHELPFLLNFLHQQRRIKHDIIDFSGLQFNNLIFDRSFSNDLAVAKLPVTFKYSAFHDSSFIEVDFTTETNFVRAHFANSHFVRCKFLGKTAVFAHAVFIADIPIFHKCKFAMDLESESVITKSKVSGVTFKGAQFRSDMMPFFETWIRCHNIDFSDALITADWFNIRFCHEPEPEPNSRFLGLRARQIHLKGLNFAGRFECTSVSPIVGAAQTHLQSWDWESPPIILFSGVDFSQMQTAMLVKMDLRKTRFTYSNILDVTFIDPRWPIRKGKNLVYDEIERVDDTDDEELRRLYMQLRTNYSRGGDFAGANAWYYRETECRRRIERANPTLKWYERASSLVLYGAYKKMSGYSTSILRPIWWIIGLWLIFTPIYLFNGVKDAKNIVVDYSFSAISWDSVQVSDLCEAAKLSASALALFAIKYIEVEPEGASIPYFVLHVILNAIVVALLVFAVRVNFRRK